MKTDTITRLLLLITASLLGVIVFSVLPLSRSSRANTGEQTNTSLKYSQFRLLYVQGIELSNAADRGIDPKLLKDWTPISITTYDNTVDIFLGR